MRQSHIVFLIFVFIGASLLNGCSCSSSEKSDTEVTGNQNDSYGTSYSDGSVELNKSGNTGFYTAGDNNNAPAAVTPPPAVMDDVEDRYEEGRAQAEEDRLAGHPGMNNEDDDDDYQEGYEDE